MNSNDLASPSTTPPPATATLAATGQNAAARIASGVRTTAGNAREQFVRAAEQRKAAAADRLGGYSAAVHRSAESFEPEDPNIAWFAHRAADRLQAAADYVRERDFAGWKSDVEDLARRHPVAFFGGLFVTGILVGGVLKASASTMSAGRPRPAPGDTAVDLAAEAPRSNPEI